VVYSLPIRPSAPWGLPSENQATAGVCAISIGIC